MSRYAVRPVGVWDAEAVVDDGDGNVRLGRRIVRGDPEWAEYQSWLAAGNMPDPAPVTADPPLTQSEIDARAEIVARAAMRDYLRADSTLQYLRTHTPAEAALWVDGNVNDLASAKFALGKLAMIAAYLARERLR